MRKPAGGPRGVATTSPFGAGKWRLCDTEALRGRRVVVLPDNDAKGLKHATDAADSLVGRAAEVRLLRLRGLPEGGDIVDWLDNGGTLAKLMSLVEGCPRYSPSPDLTQETQEPQENQDAQDTRREDVREKKREVYEAALAFGQPISLPFPDLIEVAYQIHQEQATDPGGSSDVGPSPLWQFTRVVKGHPEMAGLPVYGALQRVEAVLATWPRPASTEPWSHLFGMSAVDAQAAFCANWIRIYSSPGVPYLVSVVQQARANSLPMPTACPIQGYTEFLNVLYLLQEARGKANLRLSTRALAAPLGVSHDTVARWIRIAAAERLLSPAKEHVFVVGGERKCAEYRLDMTRFTEIHGSHRQAAA